MIHGEDDKIASPEAASEFFQITNSRDKTFKLWKEVYHDMEREPEGPEIAHFITSWIEKHC